MNILLMAVEFSLSSTVSVVVFVILAIISTMMRMVLHLIYTWWCCRYVFT